MFLFRTHGDESKGKFLPGTGSEKSKEGISGVSSVDSAILSLITSDEFLPKLLAILLSILIGMWLRYLRYIPLET